MSKKNQLQRIKAFGMTNQMLLDDLSRISEANGIELLEKNSLEPVESIYYPQFDANVRAQASEMAKHYEFFYSLETSIRKLVSATIEDAEKREDWWQY
jgi:hypothetical protein